MKFVFISLMLILAAGCSHKIVGKNCKNAQDTEYAVCDSLNLLGK